MQDIKIALVQMNALVGKVDLNLATHEKFVKKASRLEVELICFPELSVTGHWPNVGRWDVAEKVPDGKSVKFLTKLCEKYNLYISAGLAEKKGPSVFNTQVIVSPAGLLGKQRKLHPSGDEYFFYRAGSEQQIIDIGKAKIGIAICFDNMFPEVQRCLALKGAEVVLMPHAARCGNRWPLNSQMRKEVLSGHNLVVKKVFLSRCYDNGQFGIYCNQIGHAGPKVNHAGGLTVIGPYGDIIEDGGLSGGEKMIITVLHSKLLEQRRKSKCFNLLVRRPQVYKELTNTEN